MSHLKSTSPQGSIRLLIDQLEAEVRTLSGDHQSYFVRIMEAISNDVDRMQIQFDLQLITLNDQHNKQIVELEGEIRYLKELTMSQRMMMEDNLKYLKGLEHKLNSPASDII